MRHVYALRRGLATLALIALGLVVWFFWSLLQPFAGDGHGRVVVIIPAYSGTSGAAALLQRDGVIDSAFFFEVRAVLAGDRSEIRTGYHVLKLGMSYGAALKALTTQSGQWPSVNVTIVPGLSRQQVQARLRASGIKGDYLKATRRSPLLNPQTYGAPADTPTLEGFLWPDTYRLSRPVRVAALVTDQLTTFKHRFAGVNLSYAKSRNLTAYDVLTIASLIAQESMLPADGPKVASVIYNRLRDGMDLGLDSTVAYATGNYATLTVRDLNSSSPWNTMNHPGLPPTPIDSPSLADIKDAARPAKTNYLYFIDKVCGNGRLRFTASYGVFQIWSTDWKDALSRGHGNAAAAEFCKRGKL
ncbi:MAG: endolytic transglycosylase MltG [Solirubrobacteraceae bacterium]